MSLERTMRIVQVTYPQVYLACHTRHQRRRTSEHRLSERDSAIPWALLVFTARISWMSVGFPKRLQR